MTWWVLALVVYGACVAWAVFGFISFLVLLKTSVETEKVKGETASPRLSGSRSSWFSWG